MFFLDVNEKIKILNKVEKMRNKKRQNTSKCILPFVNAEGFEPSTACLEGRCSIQLSYASILYKTKSIRLNGLLCDHGGICTLTPFQAPPHQDGESTVSPHGLK